jgi:hypothetical protein
MAGRSRGESADGSMIPTASAARAGDAEVLRSVAGGSTGRGAVPPIATTVS